MRLPGIEIHSDFEWQPALRFIGTPFAANRIRYCNGRNLRQSQAKNTKWTGIGRSGSILSQNFIHRFSPRQLINKFI